MHAPQKDARTAIRQVVSARKVKRRLSKIDRAPAKRTDAESQTCMQSLSTTKVTCTLPHFCRLEQVFILCKVRGASIDPVLTFDRFL